MLEGWTLQNPEDRPKPEADEFEFGGGTGSLRITSIGDPFERPTWDILQGSKETYYVYGRREIFLIFCKLCEDSEEDYIYTPGSY